APVMPVVIGGEAVPDSLTMLADLKAQLTPAGAASAATQVAATEEKVAERWRTLPAITSVNRIRGIRPGAVVLLNGTVPAGGRVEVPGESIRGYEQPMLVYQRYGRGVAIALPVQDTWQWRMSAEVPLEDRTLETFWRQLLRWLSTDVPDRVMVSTAADVVGAREPIALNGEVADSAYVMRNDARVIARVTAPSGTTRDVSMAWAVDRDGEYRATFTPEETGLYEVRLQSDLSGAAPRAASRTRAANGVTPPGTTESQPMYVRVAGESDMGREFFGAEMRASLLQRIAKETGGRFYTPETVSSLPEDIALSKRGVTVVNQMDLWDMPIVFLVLVALVTGEWAYRKMRGLV